LNFHIFSGERPFKCTVCDKAFTQASNLAKHKLLHTGKDLTFAVFRNENHYNPRFSVGEKPFKCKECNKAFTQRANLKKHELIHSGIKPFLCHLCLKPQSQLANLKKHLAAHEKNKTIKPKV
jgi:KRAB domain-containing zinc finger protein